MAEAKTGPQTALRIERTLRAAPQKVFEAWTQAEALTRWFAPSGEFTVHISELDVRVGGRYRIEMRHVSGRVHTATGRYLEVVPARRLAFTWGWVEDAVGGDGRVTVELTPECGETRLVLVHENLPDADSKEKHAQGWNGCLDQLANKLQPTS